MTTPTDLPTAGPPVNQLPLFVAPEGPDPSDHPAPDFLPVTGPDYGRDAFTTVTTMWSSVADRPAGRAALAGWAAHTPALAPYRSPAAVVAAIDRPGQPVRSCALLAALLLVAENDPLAQLAVLRANIRARRAVVT